MRVGSAKQAARKARRDARKTVLPESLVIKTKKPQGNLSMSSAREHWRELPPNFRIRRGGRGRKGLKARKDLQKKLSIAGSKNRNGEGC